MCETLTWPLPRERSHSEKNPTIFQGSETMRTENHPGLPGVGGGGKMDEQSGQGFQGIETSVYNAVVTDP